MIIPSHIIQVLLPEEINLLVRFYGTDMYAAYLAQLKKKYRKLYRAIDED